MTREEWAEWFKDLRCRLPETSAYVSALPPETRDMWFREIFEVHELRDAVAMNRDLMESGEGLKPYERDQLPRVFFRGLQHAAARRATKERGKCRDHIGAWKDVTEGDVMGPVYRQIMNKMDAYRTEHKVRYVPDDARKKICNEAWKEYA